MALRFVLPSQPYGKQLWAFRDACIAEQAALDPNQEPRIDGSAGLEKAPNFDSWLFDTLSRREAMFVKEGQVTASIYLIVEGGSSAEDAADTRMSLGDQSIDFSNPFEVQSQTFCDLMSSPFGRESTVVGIMDIRHELNDALKKKGGHIGFTIHPEHRGKGFATQALAWALKWCKNNDIAPLLLTCDEDNLASARVIEKNGGVLSDSPEARGASEGSAAAEASQTRHYWIYN